MRYIYLQNTAKDAEGRALGFFGYKPGQPMLTIETGNVPMTGNFVSICEDIWERHNRDDRPFGTNVRSMCIGDVLIFETESTRRMAFAAQTFGFDEIAVDAINIVGQE